VERNLGTVDRVVRGSVGTVSIAVGGLLVRGLVGVALCLLGALLVLSAATGFCHVYEVFRISTLNGEGGREQ
jgi:uncharacterized membrane protein